MQRAVMAVMAVTVGRVVAPLSGAFPVTVAPAVLRLPLLVVKTLALAG